MVLTLLAFALSTLSTRAAVSTAQAHDTAAVERAVAEYIARALLPRLPPGSLAVESRDETGRERSPERIHALESVLDGRAAHEDAVVVCGNGPATCHMNGYTRFVRIQLGDWTDSTVSATVTLRWPSGQPRIPVYLHEPVLLFQQRDHQWRFVRVVSVRDT